MRTRRSTGWWCATGSVLVVATACGGDDPASTSDGRPTIAVTYSVLGAVVRDAVGQLADVTVLIPNGADPHEWEPSARDIEALNRADLIVRNGLDLEGGLQDALDTAADEGVPTFVATDHITLRTVGQDEGIPSGDPDQAVGADDPHLWMDPLTVRDVIDALGPVLADVGIDATDGIERVDGELVELDATLRSILEVVPPADRQLVTGHESMGYFAARYDLRLVGAIVPSLTSQADVSSGELAELADLIEASGAKAIFTEIGTPTDVAEAIARETGTEVVAVASHNLPDDGTYATFLTETATRIAGALT